MIKVEALCGDTYGMCKFPTNLNRLYGHLSITYYNDLLTYLEGKYPTLLPFLDVDMAMRQKCNMPIYEEILEKYSLHFFSSILG